MYRFLFNYTNLGRAAFIQGALRNKQIQCMVIAEMPVIFTVQLI